MLSEISQTQRTNIILFHLYEVPRTVKCVETQSTIEVPGTGENRLGKLSFNGYRGFGGGDEKGFRCR